MERTASERTRPEDGAGADAGAGEDPDPLEFVQFAQCDQLRTSSDEDHAV